MRNGSDGANGGGNWITGVDGFSVCVRSITLTLPSASAAANRARSSFDIPLLLCAALWPSAGALSWNFVSAALNPRDVTPMSSATVTNA